MDFSDFFGFFKKKAPASGSVAKDRLKLVLVHDRVDCSTQVLEMLKGDIIKVISNYMEIDEEELDINITQTKSDDNAGSVPVLYANIPIKSMRRNAGSNQ
ncbi:MAG: cell division topological specificity factor MinE [Firmicutes bacterium]|nr:cell division topological specificity factor MinE [Bacillota bacterium]